MTGELRGEGEFGRPSWRAFWMQSATCKGRCEEGFSVQCNGKGARAALRSISSRI